MVCPSTVIRFGDFEIACRFGSDGKDYLELSICPFDVTITQISLNDSGDLEIQSFIGEPKIEGKDTIVIKNLS